MTNLSDKQASDKKKTAKTGAKVFFKTPLCTPLVLLVADPGGGGGGATGAPPKIWSTVIFFYNPFCIRMLKLGLR